MIRSPALAELAFGAAERGWIPDALVRAGVRRLARGRLERLATDPVLDEDSMRTGPIAPAPAAANEQHYEVPPEFFRLVLGTRRKYSCAYWPDGVETLDEAELAMLDETADTARLVDGQDVLDLGCGWGAFSLYAAARWPGSRFLAVSNSGSQRTAIDEAAGCRGLTNLEVRTEDVNDLHLAPASFDRIVSVEMFEHMRNYAELMERLTRWLRPGGKLFVHVFCHRDRPYRFVPEGAGDWMAREFFTGGLMPGYDLLPRFAGDLRLEARRFFPGTHYRRTAEAWLERLDRHRVEVERVFAAVHGAGRAVREAERWRLFFLACAETFGLEGGSEWGVAHYRFAR